MEELKRKAINEIIDSSIKSFADGFEIRHIKEVDDPNGVINSNGDIYLTDNQAVFINDIEKIIFE